MRTFQAAYILHDPLEWKYLQRPDQKSWWPRVCALPTVALSIRPCIGVSSDVISEISRIAAQPLLHLREDTTSPSSSGASERLRNIGICQEAQLDSLPDGEHNLTVALGVRAALLPTSFYQSLHPGAGDEFGAWFRPKICVKSVTGAVRRRET